jgi:LDH2 family malate/lactate/ureidoglycolate dehydrogenase
MRRVVDHIHAIRPVGDDPVLVPGDRRAACRAERASSGVPVDDDIAQQCRDLASATGVPFPDPVTDRR